MKSSVIQDLRNLADSIEVSINNSQTTSVGCCSWLYRLFCGPSATLAANTPLLSSDFKSNFIALANNLVTSFIFYEKVDKYFKQGASEVR